MPGEVISLCIPTAGDNKNHAQEAWTFRAECGRHGWAIPLYQDDKDESIASSRQRLIDCSTGTSPGSPARLRNVRLAREQNLTSCSTGNQNGMALLRPVFAQGRNKVGMHGA
jgi:hypothetical protein